MAKTEKTEPSVLNMTIEDKFKIFFESARTYWKYFGMLDWEVAIALDSQKDMTEEDRKAVSRCCAYAQWSGINDDRTYSGNQLAEIVVVSEWLESVEEIDQIKITAFHEILEILFSRVRDYANNNTLYIPESDVDREMHRIIRVFENTLFNDYLLKSKE